MEGGCRFVWVDGDADGEDASAAEGLDPQDGGVGKGSVDDEGVSVSVEQEHGFVPSAGFADEGVEEFGEAAEYGGSEEGVRMERDDDGDVGVGAGVGECVAHPCDVGGVSSAEVGDFVCAASRVVSVVGADDMERDEGYPVVCPLSVFGAAGALS